MDDFREIVNDDKLYIDYLLFKREILFFVDKTEDLYGQWQRVLIGRPLDRAWSHVPQ